MSASSLLLLFPSVSKSVNSIVTVVHRIIFFSLSSQSVPHFIFSIFFNMLGFLISFQTTVSFYAVTMVLFLKCRFDISFLFKNLQWLPCISKIKPILLSTPFNNCEVVLAPVSNKETEAQKGKATCLEPHRCAMVESRLEPGYSHTSTLTIKEG